LVKQFVDHFRTKEYGFNFFPALGWIFGVMAGQAISLVLFTVLNLLRERNTISLHAAPAVFYSVAAAVLFVFVCHVVKDDSLFPVVFSLSYVLAAIFVRLISYVTAAQGVFLYSYVSLVKYLFDPLTLASTFFWALTLSLAVVLLYAAFGRLDYALLFGFPAGEMMSYFFYPVVSLVRDGKFNLMPEFLLSNLVEAFLAGFFFTLAYTLFLRARGLKLSGQGIVGLGEETAPRTRLIPLKAYFGLMLAAWGLNLALLGFVIHRWNWTRVKGYELEHFTGTIPNLETGVPVLIVLSAAVLILSLAASLLCVYKMWSALQDGKASTSPGMAVGFLFVPVFNFYWSFRVFYGFAREHNALVARQALNVPPLPAGLYLAQVILSFVAGGSSLLASVDISIPVIAVFLLMPVSLAAFYLTCQAVNRIPKWPMQT